MALFARGINQPRFELNLTNVLVAVIMALVLIQAFGLVLGGPLGLSVHLGPVFVLLPLAIASLLGIAIVKKMMQDKLVTKQDIFAVVIVMAIATVVMIYLPKVVPEIFEQSVVQLQSMVGFP